jgi:hypothetical protein
MLKSANHVADQSVRAGLLEEIKIEFHKCKSLSDGAAVKNAIAHGQRSLAQLEDLSGYKTAPASLPKKGSGSWIDTQDEEDVRGRVGTGWPWS